MELADVYNALGNSLIERREGDALSAYERSLTLKLDLATAAPDDPETLRGLSQAYNNLANMFASDHARGQVLAMYQQAMDLTREALRLRPGDTNLGRKLFIVTGNLASTLAELHRDDEAIALWGRTVAALQSMARANPEVPDVHLAHLQSRTELANAMVHLNRNRAEEAVSALLDGQDSLEHLPQQNAPDLVALARQRLAFVDRLRAIKPQLTRATALASDDQLDRAIAAFRRAVAAGWNGLAEIRSAEALRSRPAYLSLLSEAEQAARSAELSSTPSGTRTSAPATGALAASPHSKLDLRRSHAIALGAIGRTRFEAGQHAAGQEALERSLKIFRDINRDQPQDPLAIADVASGQTAIGQVLWGANRLQEAAEQWRAACLTLRSFSRMSGRQATSISDEQAVAAETALESWQAIARTYAQHGLCQQAAEVYEEAAPLARQTLRKRVALDLYDFNATCLRLQSGDLHAYQRHCAELVALYGSSDDPWVQLLLAWVTALHPQSGVDPDRRLRLAAAAESALQGEYLLPLAHHVLGMAYLRSGQWDQAALKLGESEEALRGWPSQPANWSLQAIIAYRRGKLDEARIWLDRARSRCCGFAHLCGTRPI